MCNTEDMDGKLVENGKHDLTYPFSHSINPLLTPEPSGSQFLTAGFYDLFQQGVCCS